MALKVVEPSGAIRSCRGGPEKGAPVRQRNAGGCSTGCGSSAGADGHAVATVSIEDRVRDHPCFSKDAHHHYARMHVAVAPACNIQCHYCNRKYDCSNESRPGVVSELLSPRQAVNKVLAVAAEIPQLTVLGIAGPGDPLANPERTFATFAGLSEKAPDIRLCVSTNGLMLPDYVDQLCEHNIDHVTITINCVDPDIGTGIYPWIFWKNQRIRGRKAAAILIERQLQGLRMLADRGVLVKINSVLIPGVNDHHLAEVSRVVKESGAFLHNIMPLIAEPEHGTFFGLMGQRSPSADELAGVQQACANDMEIMSHCRQCRADAIGMLGQDRHAEFTLDRIDGLNIDHQAAMQRRAQVRAEIEAKRAAPPDQVLIPLDSLKISRSTRQPALPLLDGPMIAVASSDGERIDESLTQASRFRVYRLSASEAGRQPWRQNHQPVATERLVADADLAGRIDVLRDCDAVFCTRVGFEAWQQLESLGIRPITVEPGQAITAALAEFMAEWQPATEALSA